MKQHTDRRSFIKVSSTATGGLLLGFQFVACKTESKPGIPAPNLEMPESWSTMNGFVEIGNNGVVTIMSPNPEIGQNVKTSMPMIIAEELDADWDQVIVKQAPLDTEQFTRQIAGGSQSIRHGWTDLRTTGATARQMLVHAAAEQLGVDAASLTTEKGVIHHKGSGKSLTYGDVADAAAKLSVPTDVKLKDPKTFTLIGQATRNVDGYHLVTGKPLFGLDIQKSGMKYAAIVHPPAFGMSLGSFDDRAVRQMPGVTDVFSINVRPEGAEQQWSDINAFPEIVAIVGNSTWEVFEAKKKLKVNWVEKEKVGSSPQLAAALEKQLEKVSGAPARRDGNATKAFAEADQIIERTFTAPFLAHNTMEPMNFFADVSDGKAYLEGPIQTPEYLQKTISAVCGIPLEKVEIHMTRMGGGFGRRLYGHFGTEAAVISQKIGGPVKMVYTREDDMTQGTYRPDYRVTYKAGIKDGQLTALTIKGTGTNGSPVFADRFPAGTVDNYEVYNLSSNSAISTGAWRAPRSNFIATAEQSFIDEIAEAVGKDPIDFRLELFDRAIKDPVGEKNDYDPERYAGVLKLVREKSNWDTPQSGVHRGVTAYYCHNSYVAQVVDVAMVDDMPVVKKVHCAVDCGMVINPEGAKNQIEGGVIDGIGHAMYSKMTFDNGQPQQNNFNNYQLIRFGQAPDEIDVHFVDNGIAPTGLGEPGLPPIGAGVANAFYKATGKRLYNQPYMEEEALLG